MTGDAPGGVSIRRRLVVGTPWAAFGLAATVLGALATGALLARILSPAAFGAYFLVFSVVTISSVVARLGLARLVVRLVSQALVESRPGRARGAIRSVVMVALASSLICGAFIGFGPGWFIASRLFHIDGAAILMLLAGAWVIAEGLRIVFSETFRGFHDIARATVFGDAGRALLLVGCLGIALVSTRRVSLDAAVGLSVLASWTALAGVSVALWRRERALGETERLAPRTPLGAGAALMFVELSWVLVNQADLWVVGALRPTRDVAEYAAALRLGFLTTAPILVVNAILPPIIAELHAARRPRELERTLRSTAAVASIVSVAAFVFLLVFDQQIMGLVYGPFYERAGVLLVVLAAGQTFNTLTGSCGLTLMMTGEGSLLMWASVLGAIGTVIGEVVAGRLLGTLGVAIASSLGTAALSGALVLLVHRRLGIWTTPHLSSRAIRDVARLARR